jgi:hypothetical protein
MEIVLFSIFAMMVAFAVLLICKWTRSETYSNIWKERVEAIIAFRNVIGEVEVVGLKGITQVNPALVSRTGATAYVLTIINQDPDSLHINMKQ